MENVIEHQVRGYLVCKKCGIRIPQFTYDCDISIICKQCGFPQSNNFPLTTNDCKTRYN